MRTKGLTWGIAVALLAAVSLGMASCGPDGGSSLPEPTGETGTVSFAIKDAPLNTLQTLTIDITKATLLGAGGTANFQVFPVTGGSTSVTVDLLTLQGFGQLLGSVQVPVGSYHSLDIDYTNPQGKDFAGVAQVIASQTGFMHGLFAPPLSVTAGSLQSVLVDVDLKSAYHDQGGNQAFLTPTVKLSVVPATTPVPLRRFSATVTSTNPSADRFKADAQQYMSSGPALSLGNVTVQCSNTTIFNNGAGIITVGGVPAKLMVGDKVEIDGLLSAGKIDAGQVTLIPGSGSGNPSGPPLTMFSGTIMDVDLPLSNVTVRVQWSVGSSTTPYTDIVVDILPSTHIHRGATTITLGDLIRGNFCHVIKDPVSGDTTDFEEAPSYICGTVVSATAGAGAGGYDRIVFNITTVNQVPIAQLPFLPTQVTVDVPPGQPLPMVGGHFCIFAFFDGTAFLNISLGTGGYIGTPPPPPPSNFTLLSGTLKAGTTATVNASNEVEFALIAFDIGTISMKQFNVTIPSSAICTLYDTTINVLTTAQDAAAAINNNPGVVEVLGSAGHASYNFTADIALNVYKALGSAGPPPPGPGSELVLGFITGPATLDANGDIQFTMQGPTPADPDRNVTVSKNAVLTKFVGGTTTTLTVAEAVIELNKTPAPFLEITGTDNGTWFDGHVSLTINP